MYDSTIKEASFIALSRALDSSTRKAVMVRDGNRCFICGKAKIQIHEIVPRSHFGRDTLLLCFSMKNRVCLCPMCHEKAHTFKWRVKLLKMLSSKYGYTYTEEKFRPYRIGENDTESSI